MQIPISLILAIVDVFHASMEVAIYVSLAIFILFADSLGVQFVPLTFECCQEQKGIQHTVSHSERRPTTRERLLQRSLHANGRYRRLLSARHSVSAFFEALLYGGLALADPIV